MQAQTLDVQAAPGNTLPLQDFGIIPVNRTSALQSFLISGTDLNDNVTVTAPSGFQIRTGSDAFSTNAVILTPSVGTLSATLIDVRFAPLATGTYTSTVIATTPSATNASVPVSGTAPSGPYVFVDPTTLAFGKVSGSGSGSTMTFTVEGDNLGTTPITLTTALTGATSSGSIVIRNTADTGSDFATSLTITPVNGKVSSTTIQARIVGPVASQSNFTGTITATSGSAVAAPSNVVQVTGTNSFAGASTSSTFTVSTPATDPATPGYPSGGQPLKPFNTVPEKASASQTLLVSGSFLLNDIAVTAPNNFQISLDAAFTGLGNGGPGTITANSLTIVRDADGTIENRVVYIRYAPLAAGTESGTGITFRSDPATPIAAIVQANSIGSIESRTIFTKPPVLTIGANVRSTPQLIHIHAELVRNPVRISVSGESSGALGNPNGYAQFRISKDGSTYTDPANPSNSYVQLDPDPTTNIIDQDIYVTYAPNRVGTAQAVLQYITPDVTAAPANTLTTVVSSLGSDANKLRGTTIDVEPTRDTPFAASRTTGQSSATIAFQPDANLSGYGEAHIVLVSTSSQLTLPDVLPVDGTDYNASNGEFQGLGQSTIQDSQNRTYNVVFSGSAANATITGLNANTNYYVYVFDYNSTNLNDNTLINNAENYRGPAQSVVLGVLLPGAAPLPVGLSSFTAQVASPTAVRIDWVTAAEKNNAGFTVERSVGGLPFAAVGTVAGAGTSNVSNSYSLLDAKLPSEASQLYYRLRQTDLDGTITYSPVRSISLAAAKTDVAVQLLAYPNPAHQVVQVRVLGATTTAPLEVFDALGRRLRSQAAPVDGEKAELSLDGLPAGLYILRCGQLSQRLRVE
ncbi:MAG: T9SS type A sorting domain-containing protein [Janthinobacterium lividum]